MASRLEKWLDLARWAPSAANQQPWRVLGEDLHNLIIVQIRLNQEAIDGRSLLDPSGGGGILALGALTETLEIAARADGFELSDLCLLPGADLWNSGLEVHFKKSELNLTAGHLEQQIPLRRTHRGPMSTTDLMPQQRQIPFEIAQDIDTRAHLRINIREFTQDRMKVAQHLARFDSLRCKNKSLFLALLDEIRFRRDEINRVGLPLETLGISKAGLLFLHTCRRAPALQGLFGLGFDRIFVHEGLMSPLRNCSTLYHFGCEEDSLAGWFWLGRLLQRTWLAFTAEGIGGHPLGLPLLAYGVLLGFPSTYLSAKQISDIASTHQVLSEQFHVDLRKPGIFFRAGYVSTQAAASPRKPIVIESLVDYSREKIKWTSPEASGQTDLSAKNKSRVSRLAR